MRFFFRRLLRAALLLLGVSLLSFLLLDLAPGDYFDTMQLNPSISPATVSAIRARYGRNRSLPAEYLSWLRSALHGDWGYSLAYNRPAAAILWPRALHTLLLSGTATALAWIAALLLGLCASARRNTAIEALIRACESVLIGIPELVLALLLLLFAVRTGWFPAGGFLSLPDATSPWTRAADLLHHLFLPVLSLAAGLLPLLLMHVRASIRDALDSPFATAALAWGIAPRRILLRHALPVAANPLLSLFGLSVGLLISSTLVTETIFGWPGIGSLMVTALLERDFFLVVDCAVIAALFLLAGNLLADLLLYWTDPRVRAS